jgi:hypothetical protein
MALRNYLRHVLVATGLLLVAGACVDTPSGTAPDVRLPSGPLAGRATTSGEQTMLTPATFDPVARYLQKPHAQDYWIKQWIGPAGGVVDFLGFRIVVPAGAVDRVTKFEIRIPGDNDPNGSDRVWAEFGPHNINFRVPLRLEIPYRNTDAYGVSPDILWYDTQTKQWVNMGGQVTADGERVFLNVTHFSDWAKGAGGGLAGSGG